MHCDEAMDILRTIARDGAHDPFPLSDLADTIRRDWPDDFADILPAPRDLVGQKCPICARQVHWKGLQEAIEEQPGLGRAVSTAKLRYHARWLLYLGDPVREAPPRVSIIIPIYNRGWLVDSLIQNCLNQSYSQIEIVVVDDGSTDDTAIRLAAFGDRIKLLRQPNAGVSSARNAAVLAATGELVQFLDSDNLLHAEHIDAKVRAFATIPNADLCYCKPTEVSLFGVKPYLRQRQAYSVRGDHTSPSIDLLESFLAHGYPFLTSAVTMPRHVFLNHGPFDTDLRRCEDSRYWFRLALVEAKIIGVDRRLFYRCRMRDGLNERRSYSDDIMSIIALVRNVVDLLRRPERWTATVEYVSRQPQIWNRLLDSEATSYGGDCDMLLQTIADLPRAGRSSNRSPLPLLIFLWMLGEHGRTPQGTVRSSPTSLRELLANILVAAISSAEPLGQVDKRDWVCREPKLRSKQVFVKILSDGTIPKSSSEVGGKVHEALAFLRDIAGVVCDRDDVAASHAPQEKRKKKPRASIVVPVLANPTAAEATIASCLAQTVADRIEILAIEKDTARAAFWAERYPHVRLITSPTAESLVEAHSAGLDSAQSTLIRFLSPGDILDSRSIGWQIKTAKALHNEVVVVAVKGGKSDVSVRPLGTLFEGRPQELFSAMLFPLSILSLVGGFDLALGDAYQARYFFRLTAAGISGAFTKARSSSTYATPSAGSADQFAAAGFANLIQCLDDRHLWRHIPAIIRSLGSLTGNVTEDRELHALKTRLLEFTTKVIEELSGTAASPSPLEASGNSSFTKAATGVLSVPREALRCLQELSQSAGRPTRSSRKLSLVERLKRGLPELIHSGQ
jgi:glycosyltransferase involved in cell wall biosynthesis